MTEQPLTHKKNRRLLPAVSAGAALLFLALSVTFMCLWLGEREKRRAVSHELSTVQNAQNRFFDTKKLTEMFSVFDTASFSSLPSASAITDAMIKGFVDIYGDPWAQYFSESETQSWSDRLSGTFCGIGILSEWTEGKGLKVLFVMEHSPAMEAGLKAEDIIYSIDGTDAAQAGRAEAVALIAGPPSTEVTLGVRRGEEELELRPVRRAVTNQSVIVRTLEDAPGIGYIRITGFDANTFSQFKAAAEQLTSAGVASVIYDLRGNGGGTLLDVCSVLACILPDGDLAHIDYPEGSQTADYSIWAEGDTLHYGTRVYRDSAYAGQIPLPCAVLTDSSTASAAELFVAALRDYTARGSANAVTVGQTTYGKGVMQTTHTLSDGCYVKLTVAYYNPPCGTNYNSVGIAPDIEQSLSDKAAATSLYLLGAADDAQLQAAVAALKSGHK